MTNELGPMKKLMMLLCAVASAILAQDPAATSSVPAFAADWRVTGVIRQGGRAQASMERTGLRARFVREGDRLPGGIMVTQVDYLNRSVTLAKGNETAVIQAESIMAAPPPPPKAAGTPQQSMSKGGPQGSWPNPPQRTSVMRDGNGRWNVVFPNGRAVDMHAFAEQHGGIKGSVDYLKEHLQQQHSPEGQEFHAQQFEALKQMQAAGMK